MNVNDIIARYNKGLPKFVAEQEATQLGLGDAFRKAIGENAPAISSKAILNVNQATSSVKDLVSGLTSMFQKFSTYDWKTMKLIKTPKGLELPPEIKQDVSSTIKYANDTLNELEGRLGEFKNDPIIKSVITNARSLASSQQELVNSIERDARTVAAGPVPAVVGPTIPKGFGAPAPTTPTGWREVTAPPATTTPAVEAQWGAQKMEAAAAGKREETMPPVAWKSPTSVIASIVVDFKGSAYKMPDYEQRQREAQEKIRQGQEAGRAFQQALGENLWNWGLKLGNYIISSYTKGKELSEARKAIQDQMKQAKASGDNALAAWLGNLDSEIAAEEARRK